MNRGVKHTHEVKGGYAGITAIAVLARPGQPDTVEILAATRYPWLYIIEASGGSMRLVRRRPMPGWIEWIIGPQPDDDHIVLILYRMLTGETIIPRETTHLREHVKRLQALEREERILFAGSFLRGTWYGGARPGGIRAGM